MSESIAILISTKPLRTRTQEGRHTIDALAPERLQKLAERFDRVIIGSKASDDFFKLMRHSLPKGIAGKFRLYSRSYFAGFKRSGLLPTDEDLRDDGWREILRENGIEFVERARVLQENYTYAEIDFSWKRMEDFIRDDRVTILRTPEDILKK